MHIASGTQVRPFDLTLQILKKRSGRSEGGQILQELNSIREGKYWDDAKGGWLDPVLVRKAREEEMQYVKKHAVYEKVLEGDGEEPPSRQAGRTRTKEPPSARTEDLDGSRRNTTQDPGPTCSVQRHLWSE